MTFLSLHSLRNEASRGSDISLTCSQLSGILSSYSSGSMGNFWIGRDSSSDRLYTGRKHKRMIIQGSTSVALFFRLLYEYTYRIGKLASFSRPRSRRCCNDTTEVQSNLNILIPSGSTSMVLFVVKIKAKFMFIVILWFRAIRGSIITFVLPHSAATRTIMTVRGWRWEDRGALKSSESISHTSATTKRDVWSSTVKIKNL